MIYFSNKIEKLQIEQTELDQTNLTSMDMSVIFNSPSCESSFGDLLCHLTLIREIIKHPKCRSCTLDPLPTLLLKQSVDVLGSPPTNIINMSLTSGVFSSFLKKGFVSPSTKKETLNISEFSSYLCYKRRFHIEAIGKSF